MTSQAEWGTGSCLICRWLFLMTSQWFSVFSHPLAPYGPDKRVTRAGQARPHPRECWCCQVPVIIHLEGIERVSGFWIGVLTHIVEFNFPSSRPKASCPQRGEHKNSLAVSNWDQMETIWTPHPGGWCKSALSDSYFETCRTLLPKTNLILRQINTLWLWKLLSSIGSCF